MPGHLGSCEKAGRETVECSFLDVPVSMSLEPVLQEMSTREVAMVPDVGTS